MEIVVRRPLYAEIVTTGQTIRIGIYWWRRKQIAQLMTLASILGTEVRYARPETKMPWVRDS